MQRQLAENEEPRGMDSLWPQVGLGDYRGDVSDVGLELSDDLVRAELSDDAKDSYEPSEADDQPTQFQNG